MKSYLSVEQTVVPRDSFLESPETFRVHVVWQIFFVSSKPWRLEARNLVGILIFIPFTTYEKTSFTEIVEIEIDFSGPKGFRDFRETGLRCVFLLWLRVLSLQWTIFLTVQAQSKIHSRESFSNLNVFV